MLLFEILTIFKSFQGLLAVQSSRLGGISISPYDSLNLGMSSGDNPQNVILNRDILWKSLDIEPGQVVLSHQIHQDRILIANKPGNYEGFDALITRQKNVFLAVSIADCTPVLVYDSVNEVVAAIHAGWKGTLKKIVFQTLEAMQVQFGTQPHDCFAYVGTCISQKYFEVGEEVSQLFEPEFKKRNDQSNKYHINLKEANRKQLTHFGIPKIQIEVSPYCTVADNDYFFSYRKEKGKTGRMFAVIGMKGETKI